MAPELPVVQIGHELVELLRAELLLDLLEVTRLVHLEDRARALEQQELAHRRLQRLAPEEDLVELRRVDQRVVLRGLRAARIVRRPQAIVREDLVGLADVLEALGGVGIVDVLVRVQPQRRLAVGLLDLGRGGVRRHAEQVVHLRLLHRPARPAAGRLAGDELLEVLDRFQLDLRHGRQPLARVHVPLLALDQRADRLRRVGQAAADLHRRHRDGHRGQARGGRAARGQHAEALLPARAGGGVGGDEGRGDHRRGAEARALEEGLGTAADARHHVRRPPRRGQHVGAVGQRILPDLLDLLHHRHVRVPGGRELRLGRRLRLGLRLGCGLLRRSRLIGSSSRSSGGCCIGRRGAGRVADRERRRLLRIAIRHDGLWG